MNLCIIIIYTFKNFSLIYFLQLKIVKNKKNMLTFFKQIFVWWNQQTFGTRIQTIFYGKFVGQDSFGNKYYQSKSGKRWIIYKDEIDASKIPNDWYSWMHYTKNKIENLHDLKKYEWQKPHLSNQTGTEKSYHPNKENNEISKKYKAWQK